MTVTCFVDGRAVVHGQEAACTWEKRKTKPAIKGWMLHSRNSINLTSIGNVSEGFSSEKSSIHVFQYMLPAIFLQIIRALFFCKIASAVPYIYINLADLELEHLIMSSEGSNVPR